MTDEFGAVWAPQETEELAEESEDNEGGGAWGTIAFEAFNNVVAPQSARPADENGAEKPGSARPEEGNTPGVALTGEKPAQESTRPTDDKPGASFPVEKPTVENSTPGESFPVQKPSVDSKPGESFPVPRPNADNSKPEQSGETSGEVGKDEAPRYQDRAEELLVQKTMEKAVALLRDGIPATKEDAHNISERLAKMMHGMSKENIDRTVSRLNAKLNMADSNYAFKARSENGVLSLNMIDFGGKQPTEVGRGVIKTNETGDKKNSKLDNEVEKDFKKVDPKFNNEVEKDFKKVDRKFNNEAEKDFKKVDPKLDNEVEKDLKKVDRKFNNEVEKDLQKVDIKFKNAETTSNHDTAIQKVVEDVVSSVGNAQLLTLPEEKQLATTVAKLVRAAGQESAPQAMINRLNEKLTMANSSYRVKIDDGGMNVKLVNSGFGGPVEAAKAPIKPEVKRK